MLVSRGGMMKIGARKKKRKKKNRISFKNRWSFKERKGQTDNVGDASPIASTGKCCKVSNNNIVAGTCMQMSQVGQEMNQMNGSCVSHSRNITQIETGNSKLGVIE